jgi:hypothetical protein
MTIVLQYQYWDLKVSESGFEVGLSFSDIPEKLEIPFAAVRGFYDPSVNFELEFDVKQEASEDSPEVEPLPSPAKAPAKGKASGSTKKAEKHTARKETAPAAGEDGKGADVVSLDAFRKK